MCFWCFLASEQCKAISANHHVLNKWSFCKSTDQIISFLRAHSLVERFLSCSWELVSIVVTLSVCSWAECKYWLATKFRLSARVSVLHLLTVILCKLLQTTMQWPCLPAYMQDQSNPHFQFQILPQAVHRFSLSATHQRKYTSSCCIFLHHTPSALLDNPSLLKTGHFPLDNYVLQSVRIHL